MSLRAHSPLFALSVVVLLASQFYSKFMGIIPVYQRA